MTFYTIVHLQTLLYTKHYVCYIFAITYLLLIFNKRPRICSSSRTLFIIENLKITRGIGITGQNKLLY